ncbi:MAG: CPBP family intramembrane metalloprotease [Treponema sp.]|jgi:membrane protease YdiL (CAAX protease family)|nr:CPBP family intramembrane metalloprotease [Treponema sp.]
MENDKKALKVYLIVTFAISAIIEGTWIYFGELATQAGIISLIITFLVCVVTAFGEEVGWRGLMYPVMHRIWGWKKAIIFSGFIWAVWHLPLVISGLYLPDTVMIYRIPAFIIEVFAITVIITWIRMKSNSVWTAILFHAIHNYLDQVILQSLTKNTNSAYFVGETGIITIFFTVLIAAFILIYGRLKIVKLWGAAC